VLVVPPVALTVALRLTAITGASFTAVKVIVLVVLADSAPSLTAVVSVRLVVLFEAPWYVILPAVVKYVFRAAMVPAKVRAVAVPATVIPVPTSPVIVPSLTESVAVSVALSASAKGVPVYVRLPATSSVKAKLAGALAVGARATTKEPLPVKEAGCVVAL
jgi:hypothetical protein